MIKVVVVAIVSAAFISVTLFLSNVIGAAYGSAYQTMVIFLGGGVTFYFIAQEHLKKTSVEVRTTTKHTAPQGYEFIETAELAEVKSILSAAQKSLIITASLPKEEWAEGSLMYTTIVTSRETLTKIYEKPSWEELIEEWEKE